ncbi:MAG: TRAP transporter large permease subunit, partial [Myxococcota bacterium]|nr:TRAP transporter large permease subunit [Myxococcota bacterium]
MSDPLSGCAAVEKPKSTSPLGVSDHGVYRVEKTVAWTSLLVMAVGYFLAILDRELTAGPGQNAIERFILKRLGQTIESADPAFLEQLHTVYAPAIAAAILAALIFVASVTRRSKAGAPAGRTQFALGAIAAIGLAISAILAVPSSMVAAGLVAGGLGFTIRTAHSKGELRNALLFGLPLGALGLWFCATVATEGYTWAKSLSKILLMWVGFLGASLATYENRNVQVDFVRKNVPAPWLRTYEAIGSTITGLFTIVLAFLAYHTITFSAQNSGTLPSLDLPEYIIPLPIGLGFVIIAVRYFIRAARLTRGVETLPLEGQPSSSRTFFIICGVLAAIATVALIGLGPSAWLVLTLLLMLLTGAPLFVLIGAVALACFAIWPEPANYLDNVEVFNQNFNLMERMRELADQESLIAIPFFMIAGAIMSRGAIARQLVECAAAAFGWLPGGLAISAVAACMFFAAISGSSPVTVITIGAIMLPALKKAGYPEQFSLGLVTSAGSLGIIIPPSIPMIIYAIFATLNGTPVDIKDLFIAGVGPGLVIGASLAVICIARGISIPREPFSLTRLLSSLRDGFWALFLPAFILIGIYFGIFNAIEASAIAVILALLIELFIHRELQLPDLPAVLSDSAALMGSILVIISVALGLSEFLTTRQVPDQVVNWLASYELTPVGFVMLLNVMLIIVGCMMDIISALILFVPLIIPLANQLGIDPIHLGLIFIVNLEIGYLTPPLGLNLFVASGFFQKPFGQVMKSVLPFIGALVVSLALITAFPTISLGLVNAMHDRPIVTEFPSGQSLKPTGKAQIDAAPSSYLEASAEEPEEKKKEATLVQLTNQSRVSEVEGTGDLVDFDAYGVRAFRIEEAGVQKTVVVITSETENCEDEADAEDEWYRRIALPTAAKKGGTFSVGTDVIAEL